MLLWIQVQNKVYQVDSRSFSLAKPKTNKHGYWNAGQIETREGHIHIADVDCWSASGYFDHCEEVNKSIEAIQS